MPNIPTLKPRMQLFLSLLLGALLSACVPIGQSAPQQTIPLGELLLDDTFTLQKGWEARESDWAYMDVINEGYRMWLTRNVYIYGLYRESFTDTVMEASTLLMSDNPKTIYGLRCRASEGNPANGYYFMLSADGAFSIRYGAGNAIEPLVKWQNHSAIYTDGRINTIRIICAGDYLALYVNNQFVADVTDDRYSRGFFGAALALPEATTLDNPADVVFDNVRVWAVGD
ncbi:hypothetical protein G4Y79_09840 [Phototrophicus methaneseepsis]|uniref:DUF1080 domain-containing protein n=1 Tax=Phototrophicus methaneseepsis TaxID=2710758 RepID=A0A7S8ECW7_9CHLR|nr:hypothetical protein [Phototrophicus methaneseepsis]QPC84655.1 hypothetical protein G4Y79_09840 [Phototrophicus methaneseepsis]